MADEAAIEAMARALAKSYWTRLSDGDPAFAIDRYPGGVDEYQDREWRKYEGDAVAAYAASGVQALEERVKVLEEALERAAPLVRLVTVRQVIEADEAAIEASGINPWAINEGLAEGHERISTWWLDDALAKETGR